MEKAGNYGDSPQNRNLLTDSFAPPQGCSGRKNIITDFTAGTGVADVLRLSLGTAFDTLSEVLAAATQVGANTVITFDVNNTITLNNVTKTALVADDFAFV
jgi:serralysin